MLNASHQTTETLEANLRLYGIVPEVYAEWSDEDAARLAEIILEWSKR